MDRGPEGPSAISLVREGEQQNNRGLFSGLQHYADYSCATAPESHGTFQHIGLKRG